MSPNELNYAEGQRKNKGVSEHCVVKAPAVVKLQQGLQGVRQARAIIVSKDLLLRSQHSSISLCLLSSFGLSLRLDLIKYLALFTLVLV